jgi:YegS/Rv2252/BmrU family lipid kinase
MTKTKQWIFIVNPTSGSGYGKEMIPILEKQLSNRTFPADIVVTEKHGHATKLAITFMEKGYSHIIAVGGDGTMNEVASPLVRKQGITTGLIPAGTGNDFIQILGFPDRFKDEHWDIFFRQQTMAMDVGMVNGMYFLNGMGLGFDAEVAAKNYVAPDEVSQGSGKGKYLRHILNTLLFFREGRATITTDNNSDETNCFMNTIAIGRRFAGSFLLTPGAIANDGLLDVCMIRRLNLFQRLKILTMAPKGTHVKDSKVNYYQTEAITVDFGKKVPFHLDGELYFDTTFEVSILPEAVTMIFNPDGPHFFK